MATFSQREDYHWEQMSQSVDLLFARVGNIERVQSQMSAQMDLSAQIMDQLLRDQTTLAKQLDTTGQTVARLAAQVSDPDSVPPRRHFRTSGDPSGSGETHAPHTFSAPHRTSSDSTTIPRHAVPKMSFPKFVGDNPRIWKDKCLDYFHIFNIPESMWVTSASLNMDENAAKWLQVYKLKHGLGTWSEFISAVEDQFGSYTYRDNMSDLIALEQEGSLDDYITAFTNLQYQVAMHNTGLDEIFFVTQFIKGLRSELRAGVQVQVPKTVKKAIMLAKIQYQLHWMTGNLVSPSFLLLLNLPCHQLSLTPGPLHRLLVPCGKKGSYVITGNLMVCVCIVGTNMIRLMLLLVVKDPNPN